MPARAAQRHGLAGDHGRDRVAGVHRISIHDPRHDFVIGVDVRRGNVALGAEEFHDLGSVAAREPFQFAEGEQIGIADDAAFGAAEGNVDDGALPRHPGGQGAHLVQRDIGGEADAAFAWAARDGMLDAVSGEDFQAAIVQLDGDVDGDFFGRGAQGLALAVVQIEAGGGLVKAGFGGQPGVFLLLERQRGACQK